MELVRFTPDWIDEFVAAGLAEIEAYLAKHAAFQAYLIDNAKGE